VLTVAQKIEIVSKLERGVYYSVLMAWILYYFINHLWPNGSIRQIILIFYIPYSMDYSYNIDTSSSL
jgi:SNF family Na+-dependent transporter